MHKNEGDLSFMYAMFYKIDIEMSSQMNMVVFLDSSHEGFGVFSAHFDWFARLGAATSTRLIYFHAHLN